MRNKLSVSSGLCVLMQAVSYGAEGAQWEVFETSYESAKAYSNAFAEVEVDVVFKQGERQWKVPAFWAGDKKWTVRFAPPVQGKYTYRIECTDKANTGLNGSEQSLSVAAYKGDNPLLKHGFVQVSPGKTYFEHADGAPFFWLADTWWKNLCKRMTWEGFQELTADRKAKGFSVVQIVCGPYPDENFFAPSLENEGGQPYLAQDMSVVNPKYFDYADRRLKHLADAGIVPAIVGAWGRGDCNSMQKFGAANIKRHWRYLIARYGAYPVIWILAGEIPEETKAGHGPWAEVATYLRGIDPYHHPLTCHTGQGRQVAKDDIPVIDFDMVGGNHDERVAVEPQTVAIVSSGYSTKPPMPVLVGETCYEGHMQQGFGDVQRRMFWGSILSGAAGHTYGAAGIWHAGVEGDHGNWGAWGRQPYDWTTWKEGMNYPGSTQLGIAKKLLERYPWQKFEPHPEWAPGCFAAGIPGKVRFVYLPRRGIYTWDGPEVKGLEPDLDWHVYYWDPATGRKFDQGVIKSTARAGDKDAKQVSFRKNVPSPQDWVLVLETAGRRQADCYYDAPVEEIEWYVEDGGEKAGASAGTVKSRTFNVLTYGAVGDDKTDNTAAFSACLKAVIAAGGGIMYLPDGVYRGRIIIPPVSKPLPSWITIEIVGESEPPLVWGTIGSFPLQQNGTIVKSPATSGTAVISASSSSDSLYGGFSAVHVVIRNLDVRTYDNPAIGGIDLGCAMQCRLEKVVVNTGVYNVQSAKPTHGTKGLVTPACNNAALTILRNVGVTGYHTGILVNEHTDGDNINLGSNINGLEFVFAHHASRFGRVCAQRCTHAIAVTGKHGFSIEQLDIEIAGPGQTDNNNKWQATDFNIHDPKNLGIGDINYWVVEGNVGAVEKFTRNGGASIQARRIGSAPAVTRKQAE